jgi:hypothetical protein
LKSSFELSGNSKDIVRMIELGAAMADLFYGTKPNSEKAFETAKDFYKEFGLLAE